MAHFLDEGCSYGLSTCTVLVTMDADLEGRTELLPLNDDVSRVEADASGTVLGHLKDVRESSVQTTPCPVGLRG
jgi:hypothetical protein